MLIHQHVSHLKFLITLPTVIKLQYVFAYKEYALITYNTEHTIIIKNSVTTYSKILKLIWFEKHWAKQQDYNEKIMTTLGIRRHY